MTALRHFAALAALLLAALSASAQEAPARRPADQVVAPGPDAQERLQEALILAEPGSVIELAEGRFELTLGLSLAVDRVTLRGQGPEATVLDFTAQEAGSEGLLVTAHGVLLEDFAVTGTPGDGIKVRDARGITFRRIHATWPGEPRATNGGYGLYPVGCEDVLIEDCLARGASDAGIYVGQSRRVVVRRCRAEQNVAGIEIENSTGADVHDNVATANTGGILVFDLPDLPVKRGGGVRVFRNRVFANETPNFAPEGNIVAMVPRGTGLVVMASREVEIFENDVRDHTTTNVLLLSYVATGRPVQDPGYDPFTSAVHLHDNAFGPCGQQPDGALGGLAALAAGLPLPCVVWDGVVDPGLAVEGELPPGRGVVLGAGNGEVEMLVLDLPALLHDPERARLRRLPAGHAPPLAPLPPVRLERAP